MHIVEFQVIKQGQRILIFCVVGLVIGDLKDKAVEISKNFDFVRDKKNDLNNSGVFKMFF